MSRKTLGYLLIVLGVIAIIVSLAADTLGLGQTSGFGVWQGLGVVLGLIAGGVGVWQARR